MHGGFDDWRLFNADPTCGINFNCTANELGHLFYDEFGLTQNQSVASLIGGTNANFNLFTNVQDFAYWSGMEFTFNSGAWVFNTNNGYQTRPDQTRPATATQVIGYREKS